MKKYVGLFTALMLMLTFALAGCGSKEELEPKDALQKAMNAAMELDSYSFEGTMKLKVEAAPEVLQNDPAAEMAMNMFSNTTMTIAGAYQKDPMQAEMTLNLDMGDLNVGIPMVVTEKKVYVKVPNIPMLAMFIPEEATGKFIEIDLDELAEMSGEEAAPQIDMETQQKMGAEIFDAFMGKFEGETYFSSYSADDVKLPSGVEADQVVKFQVKEDNVEEAITTLVQKALPAVFDVLMKEEYADVLGVEVTELKDAKKELEEMDIEEIKEGVAEIKEEVAINDISITTALDEDYHIPYMEFNFNLGDNTADSEVETIIFNYSQKMTDMNKDVEFEIGIPEGDDVLTMDQFSELMGQGLQF
ncbi:hypothetical protein [Marinicrinis sediminis]|uniref:Lipoprotein n=1 Tax=Marinicrinis sediminis TaxID=1652465 RepID=A0ABW5RCH8_9BACL